VSQRYSPDGTAPAFGGFAPAIPKPSSRDGWIGTKELPGYRAGKIVARLDRLPAISEEHLYFDVLLLDSSGRTADNLSGRCYALGPDPSLEERSQFVILVAELLRHAAAEPFGLSGLSRALSFIREHGIGAGRLKSAAQMLDEACGARAVTASLHDMLALSLGEDDARLTLCGIVDKLARTTGFDTLGTTPVGTPAAARAFEHHIRGINQGGLIRQVAYIVRIVGKDRARRHLREGTDFEMVPSPEMFGL